MVKEPVKYLWVSGELYAEGEKKIQNNSESPEDEHMPK